MVLEKSYKEGALKPKRVGENEGVKLTDITWGLRRRKKYVGIGAPIHDFPGFLPLCLTTVSSMLNVSTDRDYFGEPSAK